MSTPDTPNTPKVPGPPAYDSLQYDTTFGPHFITSVGHDLDPFALRVAADPAACAAQLGRMGLGIDQVGGPIRLEVSMGAPTDTANVYTVSDEPDEPRRVIVSLADSIARGQTAMLDEDLGTAAASNYSSFLASLAMVDGLSRMVDVTTKGDKALDAEFDTYLYNRVREDRARAVLQASLAGGAVFGVDSYIIGSARSFIDVLPEFAIVTYFGLLGAANIVRRAAIRTINWRTADWRESLDGPGYSDTPAGRRSLAAQRGYERALQSGEAPFLVDVRLQPADRLRLLE